MVNDASSDLEAQVFRALSHSKQLVSQWLTQDNNALDSNNRRNDLHQTDSQQNKINGIEPSTDTSPSPLPHIHDYAQELRPLPSASVGLGSQAALDSEKQQSEGNKEGAMEKKKYQNTQASLALSSVQRILDRKRRQDARATAEAGKGTLKGTAEQSRRTNDVRKLKKHPGNEKQSANIGQNNYLQKIQGSNGEVDIESDEEDHSRSKTANLKSKKHGLSLLDVYTAKQNKKKKKKKKNHNLE